MTSRQISDPLPTIKPYALSVLALVFTLVLRLLLEPFLGNRAPYILFFLVIVIARRLWGRGPALLATVLGGIAVWYFLMGSAFSFFIANPADLVTLALYFAAGTFTSLWDQSYIRMPASISSPTGGVRANVLRRSAILIGAGVVLAGMIVLLARDFARTRKAEGWLIHTYQVINATESLRSTLQDAQASQREFLLTGDEHYLSPYNLAIAALPHQLELLKQLTADNPVQRTRWEHAGRLLDETLKLLNNGVELRRTQGADAALAAVRSGQGGQTADDLRSTLNGAVNEERRLLTARAADADLRASRGRWVLGLGSAMLIVLLVIASMVIEREAGQREQITEALRRHAGLLEQSHDSLLICRLRGAIEYWSRSAEILYGYSREEAVGQFSHELLKTAHPLGMAQIDDVLEREGHWEGELTQITKDGRRLTVEGYWSVAVGADGEKTVLQANRDVTERKRVEADRLLLATAIEQAAESVVITDRSASIQYVNPAFSRTTGYTRAEALGQNPRILKSGQQDGKFYEEMWVTLTAGKLWRGEFMNRRKNGTIYVEEATIAPVRDPSGEITNYIAIKSDITDRRKAELAVRENETMLRLFVQHAPAAIAMFDRDMRYMVVSQRWLADYRLGDKDLRGICHYDVFPDAPQEWRDVHSRCLAGAVQECKEDPFLWPDGSVDWFSWEVRPWRKADGSIGGIMIFSELITERKRAEVALAESELRYRQLFESSEGALAVYEVLYDPQGNPCDYRYVQVNPAFERITGMKARKILGRTARELGFDLEEYWIQTFGQVAKTGVPAVFERYAQHLGHYYSGSAYSPRPNQVAVSFSDVTERKQAEEALRQLNTELEKRVRSRTAALETANRELEAFAHSVSHDLRAPLRGIDGWSLALLEDFGDRLDPQGRKYLDRVRSEAQRMGVLIDDLLHLSRVSRAELCLRTVDLSSLAQSIIARLKESHPERSITFVVAPQMICTGDSQLLEIALTNLFDNAVKFTSNCSAAQVEFGRTEHEGATAYFVRDNGAGFDMAYAGMLFQPFQRLHKTSEFPGTGIGLATVQRVIHRHDGRIWAEGRVGGGATFYFTLGENKA